LRVAGRPHIRDFAAASGAVGNGNSAFGSGTVLRALDHAENRSNRQNETICVSTANGTAIAAVHRWRLQMRTLLIVALLSLGACAAQQTEMVACPADGCPPVLHENSVEVALRAQAASDLQCPAEKLTVEDIDSKRSVFSGCGRVAQYVWARYYGEGSRHAILESPIFVTAQ
jgi:hypothetical protein